MFCSALFCSVLFCFFCSVLSVLFCSVLSSSLLWFCAFTESVFEWNATTSCAYLQTNPDFNVVCQVQTIKMCPSVRLSVMLARWRVRISNLNFLFLLSNNYPCFYVQTINPFHRRASRTKDGVPDVWPRPGARLPCRHLQPCPSVQRETRVRRHDYHRATVPGAILSLSRFSPLISLITTSSLLL